MLAQHSAQIDAILRQAPVLPVIAVERLEHAVPLAQALVAGGLKVLEITLRSEIALQAIRDIVRAVPEAIVGAGTVLNGQQLAAVADSGARFAISPGATSTLLQAGQNAAIPLLPGVASASELMAALELGYSRFKFFPAEAAGGVAMLKSLAGPFPSMRFCPTGGIDPSNAGRYLALKNVMTIGGSWMATAALQEQQDWAKITEIARACCTLGVA